MRFTPAAADDLDEAFAYVSERNLPAARGLLGRLRGGIERLADVPDPGTPLSPEEFELVAPGIRCLAVEPYAVFYRVAEGGVVVLRVLHVRRDFLGELLE